VVNAILLRPLPFKIQGQTFPANLGRPLS
jgi:hypothetical protein